MKPQQFVSNNINRNYIGHNFKNRTPEMLYYMYYWKNIFKSKDLKNMNFNFPLIHKKHMGFNDNSEEFEQNKTFCIRHQLLTKEKEKKNLN